MFQRMPLSLTVSCFSKIQIGFAFLVPAHPGSPGKRAAERVCVCLFVDFSDAKTQRHVVESTKMPVKSQQRCILGDAESFSDLELSLTGLGGSEITSKKAEDEWNWNDEVSTDVQLDSDKPSSTVEADELSNLSADDKTDDDDIGKMEKEPGCMLIPMSGTEEDGTFIIVSPTSTSGEALLTGKIGAEGDNVVHKCKSCDRQFARKQSLVRHEKMHDGTKHACSVCGMVFYRRSDLDSHIESKHVSQPGGSIVKCSTCHKECSSLAEFSVHLKESPDCASTDDRSNVIVLSSAAVGNLPNYHPFLCDICGKHFSTALSLRMHHKLHTGERPHACETCGRSFMQKIQLTAHEMRHLGIKPFACTMCERTFGQKAQLTQHIRQHSGDRPFVCECGASFMSKGMLAQHRKTHSGDRPHVCASCGKAFAYKESLVVHVRTHTGEKPFECTICGSRYTQSHHLKGHMRTHTGEKPFCCHLCEKTYKNRVDLRFHCTRVHNVDITKRHAKPPIFALNA